MEKDNIKEKIIELLKKENNRPIPAGILLKKYINTYKIDKKLFYKHVDTLINEKKIKRLDDNKLVLGYINGVIDTSIEHKGIISINSNFDGYIKQFDENTNQVIKEWYVNNINLNGALNNDIVLFNPMDKFSNNNIQNAVIKKVLERKKDTFVATFKKVDKEEKIILDNKKNYFNIKLNNTKNLVDGNKILIKINKYVDNENAEAEVISILGHENDIDSDIMSVVYENNINPIFDIEVENEANLKKSIEAHDKVRRDIKDRDYITIDPATSKDLDDSIYVKKIDEDTYFLSVSIADVASYVPFNSILDLDAKKRTTSVYLADRVIPMLPHIISNDLCSLNPNEIKKTLTVDMYINKDGKINNIDVFPSYIISKQRFSYDQVNDYFKNKIKDNSIDEKIYKQLDECFELHQIIRNCNIKNGYIDLNIKEPIIILDKNNKVKEIKIKKSETAQKMIEDFMVSANQAVTIKADELKIPFIYRTHKQPSIEKLHKLEIEAKKINFIIDNKKFNDLTSKDIANWIDNNKDLETSELINKIVLRTMEKATYEIFNTGHFGLALKQYTHFTSPIRRYIDLIIHRLFWMYLFVPEYYSNDDRKKLAGMLDEIAKDCTELEINAIKTEREVNSLKFAEYIGDRIGQEFDAMISTITSFGIFVELNETCIEGLIKIKNIGHDYYKFIENNNTIVGINTNKIFSFGQKVKVRAIAVDKLNKQIDFEIVGYEKNIDQNQKKLRAKNNNIKFNKIHKLF